MSSPIQYTPPLPTSQSHRFQRLPFPEYNDPAVVQQLLRMLSKADEIAMLKMGMRQDTQ